MPPLRQPIAETFDEYFSVELACTRHQEAEAFRLRYRVYCEEMGFEDVSRFPDGLESDEFDHRAMHCLVRHRRSGIVAGSVRIIETFGTRDKSPLPIEKHCLPSLCVSARESMLGNRHHLSEVSRLAVDGRFRRRSGEQWARLQGPDVTSFSIHEKRSFSMIGTACFLAATAVTELSARHHVYVMMESRLARLLAQCGIHFQRAGNDIDYHGLRAPHFISAYDAARMMDPSLKGLYLGMRESFEQALYDFRKVG